MLEYVSKSIEIGEGNDASSTIELKAKIKNGNNDKVSKIRYSTFVETINGAIIDASLDDELEVDLSPGMEDMIENTIYFDGQYLPKDDKSIKARVYARLYSAETHNINSLVIPQNSNSVSYQSIDIDTKLVKNDIIASVVSQGPDEDNLFGLSFRMGIENITSSLIELIVYLDVCDTKGNSIECGDKTITMPASQLGYIWIDVYGMKKNKMKDAKIKLQLQIIRELSADSGDVELQIP